MVADTASSVVGSGADPTERIDLLLRDLRTNRQGLSERESGRRLVQFGPNELRKRAGRNWPRDLAHQFTHPLALLLWVAAGLAWAAGIVPVAIAVVIIIVINALFAFVQERQAERAVEALAAYLPPHAQVTRDGRTKTVEARTLVPGDVILLSEGERISADARLLEGSLEVDMSTLTGESSPDTRAADLIDTDVPLLRARDLVFSGTTCAEGEARAVVFATGMRTELGRIAALSERTEREESPLEGQVRRVAWLIALIAVLTGLAFMPLATLGAGLSLSNAVVFAVGLLVGNVPEGLLPVITLALAVGVRGLVRQGALVKRLSAVETLGATSVICTDKTGTLTENRMRPVGIWTAERAIDLESATDPIGGDVVALRELAQAAAACSSAALETAGQPASGDPTELAMLEAAAALGADVRLPARERARRETFHFDPELRLMTTIDERTDGSIEVHCKGAPDELLQRSATIYDQAGEIRPLDSTAAQHLTHAIDDYANQGLRVLGVAVGKIDGPIPTDRQQVERDLCFVGMVAMLDRPRPEVRGAVERCHQAGIRIIVVTGDHPRTAAAIAQRTGIAGKNPTVITGSEFDRLSEDELDALLRDHRELIFARSTPEGKVRIADALRAENHVVAMTGDGVNDAPALRRADIGVAMGRSGTDVAREASTMVLTDDNFATIVAAIEAGRRVYDNIRKFIVYIFAHTTPEVTPFLVFALAGGAIPLPLTVIQLLAFDVGTETLPALALGREPAEPGLMQRPPRRRSEGIVQAPMLLRAWLFLGVICAALAMAGFFYVLIRAGWSPGDPVGSGEPLHHAYLQATTMTFFGMVAGQIGTAFASRTEHASLRSVGFFSNRLLLWGVAFELALAALLIYAPPFQALLGTASLPLDALAFAAPFPLIVWGADELRRYLVRKHLLPKDSRTGCR